MKETILFKPTLTPRQPHMSHRQSSWFCCWRYGHALLVPNVAPDHQGSLLFKWPIMSAFRGRDQYILRDHRPPSLQTAALGSGAQAWTSQFAPWNRVNYPTQEAHAQLWPHWPIFVLSLRRAGTMGRVGRAWALLLLLHIAHSNAVLPDFGGSGTWLL